jgi:hypothetical protein
MVVLIPIQMSTHAGLKINRLSVTSAHFFTHEKQKENRLFVISEQQCSFLYTYGVRQD